MSPSQKFKFMTKKKYKLVKYNQNATVGQKEVKDSPAQFSICYIKDDFQKKPFQYLTFSSL